MNARDAETFHLVQEMIGSSSSSSSSDSMQEDEEEEGAPHAPKERPTGLWTKPMLADRLKRRKFSRAQDDHALAREHPNRWMVSATKTQTRSAPSQDSLFPMYM
jgi:hypothetical protein